ncbi:MAG TPA: GNAT family N-acetyltransferase [Gemmatimonadaceae bacterium]|jgi:GNAT superfamily N-acetyltransferase|nr:GNAT family N-acetyltransferase [Gemmatimonadaceae bacterium]
MAMPRSWRGAPALEGPFRARREDIPGLNEVFSDAFTERYRRDGMVGVRVPYLNPSVWRYAIDDADEAAFFWRGSRGEVAAFNMVHRSGVEGWMGPLAVRDDYQGHGAGKAIVRHGIEWLKAAGATVIGLETMPRTMDNIGFYSSLGFVPGRLTITTTLEAAPAAVAPELLSRMHGAERERAIAECAALVDALMPGYDFTREILLTDELSLGDTLFLRRDGAMTGFALCHTVSLVEGRPREELRVLKLAVASDADVEPLVVQLRDLARRSGTRRVAIRVQGQYEAFYARLVAMGARVRWTDLRMALAGYAERMSTRGVVLSNWEI